MTTDRPQALDSFDPRDADRTTRPEAPARSSFWHELVCLYRLSRDRTDLRFWSIALVAVVIGVGGLMALGLPWPVALSATLAAGVAILIASLSAWLRPQRYTPRRLLKFVGSGLLLAYLGAVFEPVIELLAKPGPFDFTALLALLIKATPALLMLMGALALLMWSVAAVKRSRVQRAFDALRATQERETVARQLAEARLKLLQGQIQPHFIFNTLAAVQHWVDQADPRAGPLLRALTSFLRGSTELLTQQETPFAVEMATVRHYLAIMEARLGNRMRHVIEVDHRAGERGIPPGLLLTLVENAIEHGISPALHGGTLHVSAQEDERTWTLRVSDDGVGLPDDWVDGIGLRNCRERLRHRFGSGASLSLERLASGAVAIVRIDLKAFA
jgi:two-component sensor histidine kinase